ncbi:hypothetical protein LCGC14_0343080 [marine sediment metagenome]|uniref:Uncharacterized protein n=1 Tax=marine sediment metagenome TaxID=412755 RepID=A0A0F9TCV8_9ZZZZ
MMYPEENKFDRFFDIVLRTHHVLERMGIITGNMAEELGTHMDEMNEAFMELVSRVENHEEKASEKVQTET